MRLKGLAREIAWPLGLVLACIAAYLLFVLPPTLVERGPASLMASFDLQSYFRPRFWLGSHEIWRGRLPLWNPYEYGGIPLLATGQPAALYPPKILIFGLFDQVTALWVFLVFHYLLASGGFFWFLRTEGYRGASLFVGTALWIFGTPVLASNYHPVRLACLSWMAFIVILSGRVAAGGGMKAFAGLALVVALQIFAGYPEFTIDLGLLVAVHATVGWLQGRFAMHPLKSVPLLAAAFVLGAVASAAQLVPLAELAGVARRVDVAKAATELPAAMRDMDSPLAVIPGLALFAFVGVFLRRARSPAVGYLLCVLIGGGAWQLLKYLPGFSMVRFPLAWVMLALFFFAWLGAAGAAALEENESAGLRKGGRTAALVWLALGGFTITVLWPLSSRAADLPPGWLAKELTVFFKNNVGGPAGLVLGTLGGSALLAIAVRGLLRKANPAWLWLGTFVTLAASHAAAYPHGAAPAPFAPPAPKGKIATLHGRPSAILGRALAPTDLLYGYEITDRIPSALGVEISFIPWRCRKVLERFNFIPTFGYIDWAKVLEARGFWNAMNVQFVAAHASLTPLFVRHRLWPVHHEAEDMLFENPERMGGSWVNYAVKRVRTEDEALDYVLGRQFDPAREVVLVEAPKGSYPATTAARVTKAERVKRQGLTEVEFVVNLPQPGIFVVSESAYPGWEAEVDGKTTPWLTANYMLRAVELPQGPHTVRFVYRPASVRYGLALSGLGLSAILGLYLAGRRRAGAVASRMTQAVPADK